MRGNPRDSVQYERMAEIIAIIQKRGPLTIDDICARMRFDHGTFKMVRYGLPGRLALEDNGVTMPRPVASEGYTYKLAETYTVGGPVTDGEPNVQTALSDTLTRQATIYTDIERLIDFLPKGTKVRGMLRKLQKGLDLVVTEMGAVAETTDTPVSQWARFVLDKIA
jgi:hypothetical protein